MMYELINKNYNKLNESDIQTLSIILKNANTIKDANILQVAQICNTSKSTILRVTQKLGFSGFSEFKSYLKWETKITHEKKFDNDIENLKQDFFNTCQHLESSIQVKNVVEDLHRAKTIAIYGTGQAQRYFAMEMQRMFMQINKYIYYIGATDEFNMIAKRLSSDDHVIILSLSGNTKKIEDALHLLRLNGVGITSITNFQNNNLSRMSNNQLYAMSSPVQINKNTHHNSFINYLTVIEYIFLSYLSKYQIEE